MRSVAVGVAWLRCIEWTTIYNRRASGECLPAGACWDPREFRADARSFLSKIPNWWCAEPLDLLVVPAKDSATFLFLVLVVSG